MDKEVSKEQLPSRTTVFLQVSQSNLPGKEVFMAQVRERKVIDVQRLANEVGRVNRTYTPDAYAIMFRCMADEIYRAIANGHDIDLGFGRLELGVRGSFPSQQAPFDPDRQELTVNFVPSPRMKQLLASLPCENNTEPNKRQPFLTGVNTQNCEYDKNGRHVNSLPAGRPTNLFLFGERIKLAGTHPDVGITFLSPAGETYTYHAEDVIYNTPSSLLLPSRFELTPGSWKCTLRTQYREAGGLYKEPRTAIRSFTVAEDTPVQQSPKA